ncbi:MAG: hypothetical protein Fur0040_03190 [Sideroxydans sp.]
MTQHAIPTEDGRVFYDMSGADNPCLGCGVCCMHYRVSFYQGEIDTQPGGYVPADLVLPLTPFRVCMKGTEKGAVSHWARMGCAAFMSGGHRSAANSRR